MSHRKLFKSDQIKFESPNFNILHVSKYLKISISYNGKSVKNNKIT